MKLRLIFISLTIMLIPTISMGQQGSKTLVRNNVASQTTYEYFIEEGKREPVVEKIEAYDSLGNVIEVKEFNKDGDLKLWEAFSYNENNDLVEYKSIDEKGRLIERVVYIYEGELVQEKQYYDYKDRLVKKKTYAYEYRKNPVN